MENNKKVGVIVLAAGKGTRMKSNLPKVLFTIDKKPMLAISLEKLDQLNLGQILIIVGHKKELVQKKIGAKYQYINQKELLGTGHAVKQALPYISPDIHTVIVINGDDSAFYKPETLQEIIENHIKSKAKMTIVTTVLREAEISGRVTRDENGQITGFKPGLDGEEVVCGLYLFDRNWLEENLPKVEKSKNGEYPLPALVYPALAKVGLNSVKLADPKEWRSINSKKELAKARKLWEQVHDTRNH